MLPLLLLAALEITLRLAGYGFDPHFFKKMQIGGEDYYVQNDAFSYRFFPPQNARNPGVLRMRAVKPPGTIRIFVFGESAAMGDPEPAYGPARYLEVQLRQKFPGTKFEIVNVAFTAINSHVIVPIARECARLDIGQACVVRHGTVLAVEAFEGTDAMLRRAGEFKTDDALLVKTVKAKQDFRFDVPCFGVRTLETMREAKITAAALDAGRVILLDKPTVLSQARAWGISLFGFE